MIEIDLYFIFVIVMFEQCFYKRIEVFLQNSVFFQILEMEFNQICSIPGNLSLFRELVTFPKAGQVRIRIG